MAGSGLKARIQAMKLEVMALAVAAQDTRTPRRAKILLLFLLAYAASPIDLIPDFIPVLGLLDEVILLPLGIWFVLRMIPPDVMEAARARARAGKLPANWTAGIFILLLWAASIAAIVWWWTGRPTA
ncbi:YkvA family protein [Methyloversatilis sp.]|uniref:YkvA family protein n=1 Tax=Methyloversatilis sp. TaxID=2569862 RepID=UPI0035B3DBED